MRRSFIRFGLAIAVVLVSATPALAAKPEHAPAEFLPPIEFAAGEVCEFAVTLDTTVLQAKTSVWVDEDGTIRYMERGYAEGTAENTEGDRVTHGGGYRIEAVIHPDGSVDVSASGALFVWYFAGEPIVGLSAPGAYAVHGHGTESYAPDGSLSAARFYGGKVLDLCEELAPAT